MRVGTGKISRIDGFLSDGTVTGVGDESGVLCVGHRVALDRERRNPTLVRRPFLGIVAVRAHDEHPPGSGTSSVNDTRPAWAQSGTPCGVPHPATTLRFRNRHAPGKDTDAPRPPERRPPGRRVGARRRALGATPIVAAAVCAATYYLMVRTERGQIIEDYALSGADQIGNNAQLRASDFLSQITTGSLIITTIVVAAIGSSVAGRCSHWQVS